MLLVPSVVRYAPHPYLFNFTGCALWVVFGRQHHLDAMYWLNMFGALMYAVYLVLFMWHVDTADPRRRWLLHYFIGGSAAVLLAGLVLHVLASEVLYGWFCTIVSCFASAAPLWNLTSSGVAAFSALVQIVVHALFWVPVPPPPPDDMLAPLISDDERDALQQQVELKDGTDKDNKNNDDVSDKDNKNKDDGSDKDTKNNQEDDGMLGNKSDNSDNTGEEEEEEEEKDDDANPDDLRLDVKSLEDKIALTLVLNQEKLVDMKDHSAVKVPTTSDVPEVSPGVIEKSTEPAVSAEIQHVSSAVVNKASESAAAPEQPESEGQVSA
ncbi:hypothetical protein ZWY2020_016326 [Hordeum vulgare]|nr:hypothetical protein ZWY2020_016326 [Hordeum vulgare]